MVETRKQQKMIEKIKLQKILKEHKIRDLKISLTRLNITSVFISVYFSSLRTTLHLVHNVRLKLLFSLQTTLYSGTHCSNIIAYAIALLKLLV